MKAIVIGSGISGLTSAALLAKAGIQVTVLEQNPIVGGVTSLLKKNGYAWEQGPLLLGDFLPGERAFEVLESLGIHLDTIRSDRGIEMPDYTMWRPDTYQGPHWRRERLKQLFPQERKAIDRYYRFHDRMTKLAFLASATKPKTVFDKLTMGYRFLLVRKYADMNADALMKHFFQSPKIRALFTGILADVCVAPSEFPGLGVPLFNLETAFDERIPLTKGTRRIRNGYCYIKGGVDKIVQALADVIIQHGGEIRTQTTVTKIRIENQHTSGVRLADGTVLDADLVIASGGGKEVFYDLVGEEHLDEGYAEILRTFRPMESVFMVHLGVDIDPLRSQQSALCYYYNTYDIEASIRKLRSGIYHEGDEGFLIYVPSHHSPDMAPEGHHAVTIYTVAPDTLAEGDWESTKEAYAKKLIRLADEKIPGLADHIRERVIMTPLDYRQLAHLHKSAFGGIVPVMGKKNPPHITPVDNLYFVGQQSENAGGVSAVLLGARDTVTLIKQRHNLR